MAYHRYKGLNTHLVRIFNTYGPRLHPSDGRVISNFIMQALRGEPLTIYGDGQQTRSFCYVSDLIEGILLLSESDEHLPTNIGNPVEFTILECAQIVLDVTRSKSEICFEPLPQDDPTRRKPDISKAKLALQWEPRISLREGLNYRSITSVNRCRSAQSTIAPLSESKKAMRFCPKSNARMDCTKTWRRLVSQVLSMALSTAESWFL